MNLSLRAVNYCLGDSILGECVWGYHATNLAIHLVNGLLLLGILWRTFQLPTWKGRYGEAGWGLALATALLWTVHPLQTESVTYIVQRAESLAGLFYLLVLYCVIRGVQSRHSVGWYIVAVGACWLGVGVKEVMATAPVVVLLYDRTFVEDSFRKILRQRWGLYVGLFGSWGLLVGLLARTGVSVLKDEVGSIGMWAYARSQPGIILHYLRLSLWPDRLCLCYEWPVADTLGAILPGMLVVGLLLATTTWGLRKWRGWGFLGAWFFLILAPTSSIMPLPQLAFEHRMYLPLAAVLTAVIAVGHLAAERLVRRGWTTERWCLAGKTGLVVLTAVALGLLTFRRNEAYRTELSIWEDTVEKVPHNAYANSDLGNALVNNRRLAEGIKRFEEAIRLKPEYDAGHNNLGVALHKSGRLPEAIEQFEETIRLKPDNASAHINMGNALKGMGRVAEAIEHYQEAIRLNPESAVAYYDLGNALTMCGRMAEAIEPYQEAIRLNSDDASVHMNLGAVLGEVGRLPEAIEHYQQALKINPNSAETFNNLAVAMVKSGDLQGSIEPFLKAVRLAPNYAEAHYNLSATLLRMDRIREAIGHAEEAARLTPTQWHFSRFAAWLLAIHEPDQGGDPTRAVELAQRACDLTNHRDVVCLETLAAAYASAGRFDEAVSMAKEAWQMTQAAGQDSLAEEIHMRLQLYRDRKPYREPASPPALLRP